MTMEGTGSDNGSGILKNRIGRKAGPSYFVIRRLPKGKESDSVDLGLSTRKDGKKNEVQKA